MATTHVEVAKSEYYAAIGQFDAVGEISGKRTYTITHRDRQTNRVIGQTIDYYPEDSGLIATRYYLNK